MKLSMFTFLLMMVIVFLTFRCNKSRHERKKERSFTALHQAVVEGDRERLKYFLAKDASDVHTIDKHGCTPLCLAVHGGAKDMAKILISYGADVNDGSLTYAVAARHRKAKNKEMILFLISKGADPGGDPLVQATVNGNIEIVKLLISKGADVNAKGVDSIGVVGYEPGVADSEQIGSPPLCVAARRGEFEIAKVLLANGANPKAKNRYGKTALDLAIEADNQDIVKLLK